MPGAEFSQADQIQEAFELPVRADDEYLRGALRLMSCHPSLRTGLQG